MDTLNDYYPLYPRNPGTSDLSDSEISENNEYISALDSINAGRKRKKEFTYDDFCLIHNDNLWYLWCIINEFTETNKCVLLNKMLYPNFCVMCYENSTKC